MNILTRFFKPTPQIVDKNSISIDAPKIDSNSDTPNISYPIAEDAVIIRVQKGHDDGFPKYFLYRKIEGKWYERSHAYTFIPPCSYGFEKTKKCLLNREKDIFLPLQIPKQNE